VSPVKKRARVIFPEEVEEQQEPLVTDEEFYTREVYEENSRLTPNKHSAGRVHGAWTSRQTEVLEQAMEIHGAKWSLIEKFYRLQLGNRGQVSYVSFRVNL
jgi:hypothetical protein